MAAGRTPIADEYNRAVHTHVTATDADTSVPRAGMLATVRNRRGVVAALEPFDGETGRCQIGVRICSASAVLISETGRVPMPRQDVPAPCSVTSSVRATGRANRRASGGPRRA